MSQKWLHPSQLLLSPMKTLARPNNFISLLDGEEHISTEPQKTFAQHSSFPSILLFLLPLSYSLFPLSSLSMSEAWSHITLKSILHFAAPYSFFSWMSRWDTMAAQKLTEEQQLGWLHRTLPQILLPSMVSIKWEEGQKNRKHFAVLPRCILTSIYQEFIVEGFFPSQTGHCWQYILLTCFPAVNPGCSVTPGQPNSSPHLLQPSSQATTGQAQLMS